MKILRAVLYLAAGLLAAHPSFATELYHLSFDGQDVGKYRTTFGHPTATTAVAPFAHALLFHAVTDYDQITLPIDTGGSVYEVHYDVLVHGLQNSQYDFTTFLDTPEVRSLDLYGGNNHVYVYHPGIGDESLRGFVNDRVYHFDLTVNLPANQWTVKINGKLRHTAALDATELDSVRFSMAPWTGGATDAPGTSVALANVTVEVDPHPSVRDVTNLIGTETAFGGLGTGSFPFTKADFLRGVAQGQTPPLDPAALELVFDTGTSQLLVVRRADGSTVSVVYSLTHDQEVNFGSGDVIASPESVIRRADLLEPGGTETVGSIAGQEDRRLDADGNLSFFRWAADFQVLSQTGGAFVSYLPLYNDGQHVPMLLRGRFKVRRTLFAPDLPARD